MSSLNNHHYLNQHLLIAMPGLEDPNFKRGVTLICQHNAEGALGLTINRDSGMSLGEIFSQMNIKCEDTSVATIPVLHGGPISPERGFVLHDGHPQNKTDVWDSSIQLDNDLYLSTSRDILQDIAAGNGPENFMIALGYAGWQAGQLENDLRENSWLNTDADTDIIFNAPLSQRWRRALDALGISRVEQLSSFSGEA